MISQNVCKCATVLIETTGQTHNSATSKCAFYLQRRYLFKNKISLHTFFGNIIIHLFSGLFSVQTLLV